MEKYDIYWAYFLKDESATKNQNELTEDDFTRRPALILDDDIVVKVAKSTTHNPRKEFKGEYRVMNWKESGFTQPSTIRFSKIYLMNKKHIEDKMGHLSEEDIQKIKSLKLVEHLLENLEKRSDNKCQICLNLIKMQH